MNEATLRSIASKQVPIQRDAVSVVDNIVFFYGSPASEPGSRAKSLFLAKDKFQAVLDLPVGRLRDGGLQSVVITDEGRYITAGGRDVLAAAVSGAQREAKVSLTNNAFDSRPVGATFFTSHPKVDVRVMPPKTIRLGVSNRLMQTAAREVVQVVSSGIPSVFPVFDAVRPEHTGLKAKSAYLPVNGRG